jgi:NTE family protein
MSRALVLGGGGPVGVAWETGLLAGLTEAGVDLGDADRIVGTSAGSVVGAHLARGDSLAALVAESERNVVPPTATDRVRTLDGEAAMAIGAAMFEALTGGRAHEEIILDIGRLATGAETMAEDAFVAMPGAGLGVEWPGHGFACTAYDVESGAFTVWDEAAGVPLDRAVASSCSVPGMFPPITIGGRRYMDGGVLSGTNAHLATGHDRVVVVSVMSNAVPGAADFLRAPLLVEIEALRDDGAQVELVEFDDASVAACGGNLLSFSPEVVAAMAAAGLAQGRDAAERIRALWG